MGLFKIKCDKCGEVFNKSEWNGKEPCPVCSLREEIRSTEIDILGIKVNIGDVMDNPIELESEPERKHGFFTPLSPGITLIALKEDFAIERVKYLANCSDEDCKRRNGTIVSIDEAMEIDKQKREGCRCRWVPVMDKK